MALEYDWWQYFLIPWIAGFVGYVTNVLALEMTFYPIDPLGPLLWRPFKEEPWFFFGWQGIIPTKTEKMASKTFELMTSKLLKVKEAFDKLDPQRFSEVMADSVLKLTETIVEEVAVEYMPGVWNRLPGVVKNGVIGRIYNESGTFLSEFLADMKENIDDVVDLKHFAVTYTVANRHLIVKIFQECGENEFIFIRRSGFYFGFLFGILQMCLWFVYDESWILPIAGFLVGWFTNFLALKVIFRPLVPTRFCGLEFQGIFLRRQREVAETFSRVIMTEILPVKSIWDAIFTGPYNANFFAMLRRHSLVFTDNIVGPMRPLAVAALGADTFEKMKEDIAQKVIDRLPGIIHNSYEYTQEALDLETTVATKMTELPPEEFEGVLHPAFEEDEIQLIILGGVLGALVGVLQVFTLFA